MCNYHFYTLDAKVLMLFSNRNHHQEQNMQLTTLDLITYYCFNCVVILLALYCIFGFKMVFVITVC